LDSQIVGRITSNLNYSRFRISNTAISIEEETEITLPIKTTVTNADADNYVVNEDGTIAINKAGIYLVFAKVHGSFRTNVAGYIRLAITSMYFSSYVGNGSDISLQFQESISGAFFITNRALLKLSIYSMAGQINVYPSSISPYTEIIIVKMK